MDLYIPAAYDIMHCSETMDPESETRGRIRQPVSGRRSVPDANFCVSPSPCCGPHMNAKLSFGSIQTVAELKKGHILRFWRLLLK